MTSVELIRAEIIILKNYVSMHNYNYKPSTKNNTNCG